MKKVTYFTNFVLLLLMVCFAGCKSDDDNEDSIMVMFPLLQVEVPYYPMEISSFPGSLGEIVKRDVQNYQIGATIYMGKWQNEPVYVYLSGYMSSLCGSMYDKDGELFPEGENHAGEMKDWKCVFNKKMGGR